MPSRVDQQDQGGLATSGPLAIEVIYLRRFFRGLLRWGAVVVAAFVGVELIVNSSVPALGWVLVAVAVAVRHRQSRTHSSQEGHLGGRNETPL